MSATTSSDVTLVVVGSATGVILFTVLALLLLIFIAKKRRCPWFSSFRHSHDPESFSCQPILREIEDTEDVDGSEALNN